MKAPKVILYQDKSREWRWQAVSANGRIIADSAEGYSSRAKCEKGLVTLLRVAGNAAWYHRTPSGLLTRV